MRCALHDARRNFVMVKRDLKKIINKAHNRDEAADVEQQQHLLNWFKGKVNKIGTRSRSVHTPACILSS